MVKLESAFPLIRGDLSNYVTKLVEFPPCPFWIHENALADYLGLRRGPTQGKAEALTALLDSIKRGGGGNRKQNTFVATGIDMADLEDKNNSLNIYYQKRGREQFKRGVINEDDEIARLARWFNFGNIAEISLEEQIEIANQLTGNIPINESPDTFSGMPVSKIVQYSGRCKILAGAPRSTVQRRKNQYVYFYQGNEGNCRDYLNFDVPLIAYKHLDFWAKINLSGLGQRHEDNLGRRSFDPDDLCTIEGDLRLILACSGSIGKIQAVNGTITTSRRTGVVLPPEVAVQTLQAR